MPTPSPSTQQDWDGCQSKDPAAAIASCSNIIPDETETAQNRADTYVYRASAYLAQGNLDRAIAAGNASPRTSGELKSSIVRPRESALWEPRATLPSQQALAATQSYSASTAPRA